jgi:CDP-6-deoxy-D-xylo-4-hexulose-3-dehydrase
MKKSDKKPIKLVSDTIDKKDIKALCDWLSSDEIPQLTKGPLTIQFENKWSEWLGVKHTTFVNSGSSAILLALAALKETNKLRNNKVVVPTLSWLTDVSSVMQCGMKPILVDCNMFNLSVDIYDLEEIFKKEKPSVFILVSVLGFAPDMNEIVRLCKKYGVYLIEDVCESMGSCYKDRKLGTFGDISLFSLYYGHHISTIEGGLICTNNDELDEIIRSMRSHGWDRDWSNEKKSEYRSLYEISDFDAMYTFYYPGFNLRSTDLQAFLGLRQIEKIDDFARKRYDNFLRYQFLLGDINELYIGIEEDRFISNFAYPMVHENREQIINALREDGIEVRPLIAGSMGKKPFWTNRYEEEDFINASRIDECGFYLPNHQGLTAEDIERICTIVKQYSKSNI